MERNSNEEIINRISEALEEALELVDDPDWTLETEEGAVLIKSRISKQGRKIWLCQAKVNVRPAVLEEKLMDVDNLPCWNSTVTESRLLKNLRKDVFITYQVTAEGAGGVVSARDFVMGARTVRRGERFIVGGLSVESEEAPAGGRVRAVHGPSCQVISAIPDQPEASHYTWLLNCDYRGMIPSSILNIAMPIAQTKMIESINSLSGGTGRP